MPNQNTINRENLLTQEETLKLLQCDRSKLNRYVNENRLRRVRSSKDKRYSYYLKSAVQSLANEQEEFYYE